MNIVHLVVVKNSFYNSESGRTIQKSAHFSLILGTKNLVNIGTQQGWCENYKNCQNFLSFWIFVLHHMYGPGEKRFFFILRSFDPPTNSLKIIKETPKKYKGNIAISVFWVLCKILFLENYFTAFRSISLIKTVLLIPILAYLVTFYVIWHMS